MHAFLRRHSLPLVAAHRGSTTHAPENTLAAFRYALDRGARALELDVQLSSDGTVVVIHDPWLGRTANGTGWVQQQTGAELRALDAGTWFSDVFCGERIPVLEDVLALAAGRATLNIELKHGPINTPDLEERTVALVRAAGMEEQVLFMSSDHQAVARAKRLAPEIAALLITGARLYEPLIYLHAVGADGFNQPWAWWGPDLVDACHRESLIVHASLIDKPAVWAHARGRGFDMFDTNNVELFG